jgi:hypothetical protein
MFRGRRTAVHAINMKIEAHSPVTLVCAGEDVVHGHQVVAIVSVDTSVDRKVSRLDDQEKIPILTPYIIEPRKCDTPIFTYIFPRKGLDGWSLRLGGNFQSSLQVQIPGP